MTDGNGRATIREVYDLVAETRKDILAEFDQLNQRVSSLERWRSFLAGGLGVLLFLVGALLPFVR